MKEIAQRYSSIRSVKAVVLAGSQASGSADKKSDIDLYVYSAEPISLEDRKRIAPANAEVGNSFWEPGDEWIDPETQTAIDVMFRGTQWIEDQLDRVLNRYEASVGYSTCFWHNVLTSQILFDRDDWFARLQQNVRVPYPEELRTAIIAKNYPILRKTQSSYKTQLARAIERNDPVSVHHRITAFLASYFDILFAINRLPHPGEKRLVSYVEERCTIKPKTFSEKISRFLKDAAVDELVDDLDQLL
jgi:hypothetical protein